MQTYENINEDINKGWLEGQLRDYYNNMLSKNSFTIPYLYKGDTYELGKAIEALEYLFNKAYDANSQEETRNRLSQMTGVYLTSIIVELKEYKKQLEELNRHFSYLENKKNKFKPEYYGEWYSEFKKEGDKNE